jgi:hypothetical protein
MNINTKSTFITGVFCLCQAAALGQNLLVNGSFEAGNTGFTGDYTFASTGSGSGHYDIVRNPRDSHGGAASFGDHTSGTGLMLVANGASDTNRAFWRQTVSQQTPPMSFPVGVRPGATTAQAMTPFRRESGSA